MNKRAKVLLITGALVACCLGALVWWSLGRSPAPTPKQASSPKPPHDGTPSSGQENAAKLSIQEQLTLPPNWEIQAAKHPALAIISDSSRRLPERLATVTRWLQSPISPDEVRLCAAFLCSPVPSGAGPEDRERALRNDLLNALRSRTSETAEIMVPTLIAQAADQAQDEGLRTYAVQHLASWMPDLPPPQRQMGEQALLQTLAAKESAHAGTALLGLYDLSNAGLLSNPINTASEALRMALDERCDLRSRLTALALCRQTGVADKRLADMARRWSVDSASPEIARRVAASFISFYETSTSQNPSS